MGQEQNPFNFKRVKRETKKVTGLIGIREDPHLGLGAVGAEEENVDMTPEDLQAASDYYGEIMAAKLGGENKEQIKERFRKIDELMVAPEIWEKALKYFHHRRDYFIEMARHVRNKGVSHRRPHPFQVGCVALGIEPDSIKGVKYEPHEMYNFKVQPGPRTGRYKRCAERGALEIARNFSKVIAAIITVSTETNTGDPSKTEGRVLHPCFDCRNMYRGLLRGGFIREDTIICMVNDANDQTVIEETTVGKLLSIYQDDLPNIPA
jgi:cytidine deaminase